MKIQPTFTARSLFANAAPWLLYGLISAVGDKKLAFISGLVVSLCQMTLKFLGRRRPKMLDVAGTAFFFTGVVFTSLYVWPPFARVSSGLLWWVFVAMAFGSVLVGSPFTAQYARDSVPEEYWNNPSVHHVNVTISAAWGMVFLLNAVIATLVVLKPDWPSRSMATCFEAAGYLAIFAAVVFTNRYPQWIAGKKHSEPR